MVIHTQEEADCWVACMLAVAAMRNARNALTLMSEHAVDKGDVLEAAELDKHATELNGASNILESWMPCIFSGNLQ